MPHTELINDDTAAHPPRQLGDGTDTPDRGSSAPGPSHHLNEPSLGRRIIRSRGFRNLVVLAVVYAAGIATGLNHLNYFEAMDDEYADITPRVVYGHADVNRYGIVTADVIDSGRIHTVGRNENLTKIARVYNVGVDEIATLNSETLRKGFQKHEGYDPFNEHRGECLTPEVHKVYRGQKLRIPVSNGFRAHQLHYGETELLTASYGG